MKSVMNRYFRINRAFVAISLLSATAVLFPANADPLLTLNVGPLMNSMEFQDATGEDLGGNTYRFQGTKSMEGMWDITYDLTANEDPFIDANFTFKNTSGMTQEFILSASLPISPDVVPSSLYGGSFGGSVTDANLDGSATVGTVMGSPMYSGLIDGVGVLPIYSDPTSFTAGYGKTVNITAANVGLGETAPTISGPAAYETIGITHKFTLTPGDTIAFTSLFVVEAIPEPATMGLMGVFAGGIFFVRRFFPKI